jgi:hypothetical protein
VCPVATTQVTYTPCGRLIVIATHYPDVEKKFYRILVCTNLNGRNQPSV